MSKRKADQQASHKSSQLNDTSRKAQVKRLVERLRYGSADTFTIMRELNICRPGARIADLRGSGYKILTVRTKLTDEWGRTHCGVAIYTLISEPVRGVAA
ncbi:hypothetical protein I5P84_02560 [Pseudomonas mosselii]|uniref:helix-turn-helix domain-containing protein n=1 Tax=Pseudomonas mosselii TaxID=78327 RepID=UPI0018D717FD|nr:helix-turn-helix domain-containing protein [Pseudomonas mosselii]MBH3308336.1 hypothetical protein [Pseudomonas mosselii]MBH3324088.1 hypothetical protein [Pseudomonas mosselii]